MTPMGTLKNHQAWRFRRNAADTDANPERLRPAAGRGERLALIYLCKSVPQSVKITPKKHDSPMARNASGSWLSFGILSFGIWNFFGICDFGIWDLRRSRAVSSVDKNSETGRTEFPIQLHREHREPQSSRRPACSLVDSTRTRNFWFKKTFLYYLRSLLFKKFKTKIVRSHKNAQSLAGLPNLRGPLCSLCNFLLLYPNPNPNP